MLLAPAGCRSLAKIGNLYGGAFSKVEITKDDLNNMHIFLQNDRVRFVEYAIRDALISLIHSI
jgi:hypothetical protein